jgi:hypothetical protein
MKALTPGLLLCLLCCQPAATVELTLDKAPNVSGLKSVMVVLRKVDGNKPTIFGPISLAKNPQFVLNTDVAPGEGFYFDVFGCLSEADCNGDNVAARGCHDVHEVKNGESWTVNVTLFANKGEYDLPPQGAPNPELGCPPYGAHTRPAPPNP